MNTRFGEKFAFIGAGNLAEAWIVRLIATGAVAPEQVMACDPRQDRLRQLVTRFPGLLTTQKNEDGVETAQIVAIATPPGEALPVVQALRSRFHPKQIVISLVAGVAMQRLQEAAGSPPVVRVMANIPSMVGESMNLVSFGRPLAGNAGELIRELLDLFGRWLEVEENSIEAWGALCSVGPTYIFPVIEALASAAAAAGLATDKVLEATAQVVAGTARLVQGTDRNVQGLNQMIGLHTLPEEEVKRLFTGAYGEAASKLRGLARKLAA
jgi:pyrroline-5-carboxylate reductase